VKEERKDINEGRKDINEGRTSMKKGMKVNEGKKEGRKETGNKRFRPQIFPRRCTR
jgi:hypothetical protein